MMIGRCTAERRTRGQVQPMMLTKRKWLRALTSTAEAMIPTPPLMHPLDLLPPLMLLPAVAWLET